MTRINIPNLLVTLFSNRAITASSSDDDTIGQDYREGCEVGMIQGREDHGDDKEHDDSRPPEKVEILWCIGNEIGYNNLI